MSEVQKPHSAQEKLTAWLAYERLPLAERPEEHEFGWQYDPRNDVQSLLEQVEALRHEESEDWILRSYHDEIVGRMQEQLQTAERKLALCKQDEYDAVQGEIGLQEQLEIARAGEDAYGKALQTWRERALRAEKRLTEVADIASSYDLAPHERRLVASALSNPASGPPVSSRGGMLSVSSGVPPAPNQESRREEG